MNQHFYCLDSSHCNFNSVAYKCVFLHIGKNGIVHVLSCGLQWKDDNILAPVFTLDFKPEEDLVVIKKPAALWN